MPPPKSLTLSPFTTLEGMIKAFKYEYLFGLFNGDEENG
tara:strand:+ start:776 stop:892 length:117 start_codon:yes stop_codon:yes gene_type:complete